MKRPGGEAAGGGSSHPDSVLVEGRLYKGLGVVLVRFTYSPTTQSAEAETSTSLALLPPRMLLGLSPSGQCSSRDDERTSDSVEALVPHSPTLIIPVERPALRRLLDRLVSRRLKYAPPIAPSSCLFCPHASTSTQENVQHMRAAHSFVIPEEEYLVDLEGLLRRLGEEVGTWNVCVCCGKGYGGNIDLNRDAEVPLEDLKKRASKGVEAVRAHMQSKVSPAGWKSPLASGD